MSLAPSRAPAAPSSRTSTNRRGGLTLLLPVLVVFAYVGLSMLVPFWMTDTVDGSSPPTWPSGGGTAAAAAAMSVIPRPTPTPAPTPQLTPDFGDSIVILVALEDGSAGEAALVEWASSANNSRGALPHVWIQCYPNSTLEATVRKYNTHNIFPLAVSRTSSWVEIFDSLLSQNENASLVGLFAEGSVPHSGLADSIRSLVPALSQPTPPTAVLVRSRSRGVGDVYPRSRGVGGANEGGWLSDSLVAQVWCNHAVLERQRLEEVLSVETKAGREQRGVGNSTLLQILPTLLRKRTSLDVGGDISSSDSGLGLVLVDGTNVLRSTFVGDVSPSRGWSDAFEERRRLQEQMAKHPPTDPQEELLKDCSFSRFLRSVLELFRHTRRKLSALKESEIIRIGNSKFALVLDATPGLTAENSNMVSPPSMIVKAPWPAMYVLETAASILRTEVVPADSPRGLVLVTSVNCGYLDMATNLLLSVRKTTDAKILFVAMDEVSFDFLDDLAPGCTVMIPAEVSAEVVLQRDGAENNMCTCFLFLKPTPMARALVENWQKAIVKFKATMNQPPLQQPLRELEALGMHVDVIPREVFPAGNDMFHNAHLPNYTIPEETVIVHNNWIKGHKEKKMRFVRHHLWYVDAMPFPDCGRGHDKKYRDRADPGPSGQKKKHPVKPKRVGGGGWGLGWYMVFCFGCGMFAVMVLMTCLDNIPRVRERSGRRH